MEGGPPADRRPSRRSRVASPSAANNGTAPGGGSCSATALRLRDIPRELFDLAVPPVVVHAERFGATRERDAIEPGLDNRERGAAVRFLELELDQRRGLGRVVRGRVDGVGVPAIREVALRVDALDQHFQRHMLVARYAEPAPDRPALGKRALELYPEPGAKLCRVREGAPHARAWGAEHDPFFDPISAHRVVGRWGCDCHGLFPPFDMQRLGCVLYQALPLNASLMLRFLGWRYKPWRRLNCFRSSVATASRSRRMRATKSGGATVWRS